MSKYNVAWNQESRTLIMVDAGTDVSGDSEVVSHIVYGDVGEIPDSASHPEPGQHLRNIAMKQGVDDFALVTVVNETDNSRLDHFVQEGSDEKLQLALDTQASNVLGSRTEKQEEEAEENVNKVGPVGDVHADEKGGKATHEADLTDDEKNGNPDTGLPAYNAVTVKEMQDKLGSKETDKQNLYRAYAEKLSK